MRNPTRSGVAILVVIFLFACFGGLGVTNAATYAVKFRRDHAALPFTSGLRP